MHVARIRHHHHVILILAEQIKSFGREHADDLKGEIADANGLADRIFVRK